MFKDITSSLRNQIGVFITSALLLFIGGQGLLTPSELFEAGEILSFGYPTIGLIIAGIFGILSVALVLIGLYMLGFGLYKVITDSLSSSSLND